MNATPYIDGDLAFAYDACDGEELVCECVCGNACVAICMCVWNLTFTYAVRDGEELVCVCVCVCVCICNIYLCGERR
jgi:hypothetical protein